MLANKKFSFHRPTISSGNVLSYQDPVTISLTTALNNANQANVVTFTIDTNLTTEPKLFYEITGNVSASDFTDSVPLYGSVTLDANGNATITKNVQSLGYANVDFVLNLRTGHPQTQIRATSNTVEYIDVPTVTATGGTETSNVDSFYKIHEFTANANLVVSDLGESANFSILTETEYLIVGGGGGGGDGQGVTTTNIGGLNIVDSYGACGGGGAGGNVINSNSNLTVNTFPVEVGVAGIRGTTTGPGGLAGNSSIFGITAPGGGNGGTYPGYDTMDYQSPANAHNTGGAAAIVFGNAINSIDYANVSTINFSTAVNKSGGSGFTTSITIFKAGGNSYGQRVLPQKGGCGAGDTANGSITGGEGRTSSITGSAVVYGSGGGGGGGTLFISGGLNTGFDDEEGADGGTNGGKGAGTNGDASAGADYKGAGGGGGALFRVNGANGGSGVVIVRYIEHYRKANIL